MTTYAKCYVIQLFTRHKLSTKLNKQYLKYLDISHLCIGYLVALLYYNLLINDRVTWSTKIFQVTFKLFSALAFLLLSSNKLQGIQHAQSCLVENLVLLTCRALL